MAAIIIGHSYVKRVQKYVLQSKTSMLKLKQYSHVYLHGIGGLKIPGLKQELHMIPDLECKICILDVGSNDICRDSIDLQKITNDLFDLACHIVDKYGIKVVIMQQFNRKRRNNPTVFNAKIEVFNRTIQKFCVEKREDDMITCHTLQNMWSKWQKLIISDGTHLSHDGCRRLCRNYRNALVKAYPL